MLSISLAMQRKDELLRMLPGVFDDWGIESDKYFNPETLYDYIDGGAELYISYNFKDVISRRYKNSNGDEIVVELFDMVAPDNAYGVFTQQREEESTDILQECQIIIGSIIFWRHKYFVSLMNNKETPVVKEAMLHIANSISENIAVDANKPEIVLHLPVNNLLPNSIRYFKHYVWLNSYNFISSDNIYNINNENVAVLAKYSLGSKNVIVLHVNYKNESSKTESWRNLAKTFRFRTTEIRVIKHSESDGYYGFALNEQKIVSAFNSSTKEDILELLKTT
jgi:hypothetical protein